MKLVDTRVLGTRGESCGGSSPSARTKDYIFQLWYIILNLFRIIFILLLILTALVLVILLDKTDLKPQIINAKITLINKCELNDDAFMVVTEPSRITAQFVDKVAQMRLYKNEMVRLEANIKYSDFVYDGVPKKAKLKVELIANCDTSDRLEGIFDSMREQFNPSE